MASREVSGRDLLRQARELYGVYRERVQPTGQRVAIIRFEPSPHDPPEWRARLQASRVSAEQKVKSFEHLGFRADHIVLPPDATREQFGGVLNRCNEDASTRAIIVQFPPPAHLRPVVDDMDPAKDIDALLKDRSPYRACATAEGIYRVVEPYARDHPAVAVVGSRGFVGQGVVAMMKENGLRPLELDAGDDLLRVREADIVVSVTGNAGIIGREHLRAHHRLVVDSGFVPQPDGSVLGDVRRDAYGLPQNITPVPGGIGPVEMATLMERVTRQEIDPRVTPWRVEAQPYLTREQAARQGTSPSVPGQSAGGPRAAAGQAAATPDGGLARAARLRSGGGNTAPPPAGGTNPQAAPGRAAPAPQHTTPQIHTRPTPPGGGGPGR